MNIEEIKKYECAKCGQIFTHKGTYDRHMNRKIPCNDTEKQLKNQQKRTCEYCNKLFTRIESLKDHLDICRIKLMNEKNQEKNSEKVNNDITSKQIIEKIMNEIGEIKKMSQEKDKKNEEKDAKIDELMKRIAQLESNQGSTKTTVKGKKNTVVNGDMNNIQQNIHNDIKIVAYGKEDLSFITDDIYRLLLNKGFKSVQNLVEYIHMNQNKPENQNIYISNMRDNYILIYDGNQWQLKERDDVLQEMIENKADILNEKFDELIKTLDESTIKKFKRFLDEKDEDRIVEQIKKELKLMLYNKKLIKELPPRIDFNNTNKININNDQQSDEKEAPKACIAYEHPKPVEKAESDDKPKAEITITTYRKRKSS